MAVLLVLVPALLVAAVLLVAWLSGLVVLGLATLVVVLMGLATLVVVVLLRLASLSLGSSWLSLLSRLLGSTSVGALLRRLLGTLGLLLGLVKILLEESLEVELTLIV